MIENGIEVYGTAWCGDLRRAKKQLERRGVEYAWVDIEERKVARDEMLRLNGGDRRVPTVLFPDGSVLVEPNNAELGAKLDKQRLNRTGVPAIEERIPKTRF